MSKVKYYSADIIEHHHGTGKTTTEVVGSVVSRGTEDNPNKVHSDLRDDVKTKNPNCRIINFRGV